MSDDFIPLNQSTPVQRRQWYHGRNQQSLSGGFRSNQFENGNTRGSNRGNNRRGNFSRNSSFSSDNNSYNNSFSNNKTNIDAYLHPSMLEDPWAQLRRDNCVK